MHSEELINNATDELKELEEDHSIPKNIKNRIQNVIKVLGQNLELSIKINKVLNELDEISDDTNLEPYARTKIWNAVSVLEKISH